MSKKFKSRLYLNIHNFYHHINLKLIFLASIYQKLTID